MTSFYILKDHEPVRVDNLLEWGMWFEQANRHVGDDRWEVFIFGALVDSVRVSTVFLGLDHQWGEGPPLLFESMIFTGEGSGAMDRCSTWEEAEQMHARMVHRLKSQYKWVYKLKAVELEHA